MCHLFKKERINRLDSFLGIPQESQSYTKKQSNLLVRYLLNKWHMLVVSSHFPFCDISDPPCTFEIHTHVMDKKIKCLHMVWYAENLLLFLVYRSFNLISAQSKQIGNIIQKAGSQVWYNTSILCKGNISILLKEIEL